MSVCHKHGIEIVSVEVLDVNFALVAPLSTVVGSWSDSWYRSIADSCKSVCESRNRKLILLSGFASCMALIHVHAGVPELALG